MVACKTQAAWPWFYSPRILSGATKESFSPYIRENVLLIFLGFLAFLLAFSIAGHLVIKEIGLSILVTPLACTLVLLAFGSIVLGNTNSEYDGITLVSILVANFVFSCITGLFFWFLRSEKEP